MSLHIIAIDTVVYISQGIVTLISVIVSLGIHNTHPREHFELWEIIFCWFYMVASCNIEYETSSGSTYTHNCTLCTHINNFKPFAGLSDPLLGGFCKVLIIFHIIFIRRFVDSIFQHFYSPSVLKGLSHEILRHVNGFNAERT